MSAEFISEAFVLLAKLATKDGVKRLNELEGCWTRQIGEQWWAAVNGHQTTMKASSRDGASAGTPFEVEPYHAYVEYNGWPAGDLTPLGGVIAAGDGANEDSFIAAIRKELDSNV